jgi:hypothetical protein
LWGELTVDEPDAYELRLLGGPRDGEVLLSCHALGRLTFDDGTTYAAPGDDPAVEAAPGGWGVVRLHYRGRA